MGRRGARAARVAIAGAALGDAVGGVTGPDRPGFRHLGDRKVHQGYVWHVAVAEFESPEGDAFTHTQHCLDALVALDDWTSGNAFRRRLLMFAVLAHDFGKPSTTAHTDPSHSPPAPSTRRRS